MLRNKYMKTITILMAAVTLAAFTRDKPAYLIYNASGKQVSYRKMLKNLDDADIILFGELHNCPIAHWMELEVTRDVSAGSGKELILGAEMFEADNQLILDEFLSGKISEDQFEKEARTWPNYETDYKPLVDFARDRGFPFVATNIPRRYANMVYKGGFESLENLSDEARRYFPPLPVPYDPGLPAYREMMNMGGMGHQVDDNFPRSQAIKDATMAWFIMQHRREGTIFIHFNGSYHSDKHQGIAWYLGEYGGGELNTTTVTVVRQEQIDSLEQAHRGAADFILAVPASMTNTY